MLKPTIEYKNTRSFLIKNLTLCNVQLVNDCTDAVFIVHKKRRKGVPI